MANKAESYSNWLRIITNPITNILLKKEQRFQDFTTRKHFPGRHKIGIVVNGQELASKEFMLLQ